MSVDPTRLAESDDPTRLAEIVDKHAISEIVRLERLWRDRAEWDRLASAYTGDSHVRTTWFDGTGREFAEASREMAEQRGRASMHLITPTDIRIEGDRALCESLGEIHNRTVLEGVEVDTLMYCRFFSRLRRTLQGWRLVTLDGIYHKDQIAPVDPADDLPVDWGRLRSLRPSYRVWSYMISLRGYDIGDAELGDDRPAELRAFYAAAERWLQTGQDRA
jgi:SnoaL-like protein